MQPNDISVTVSDLLRQPVRVLVDPGYLRIGYRSAMRKQASNGFQLYFLEGENHDCKGMDVCQCYETFRVDLQGADCVSCYQCHECDCDTTDVTDAQD